MPLIMSDKGRRFMEMPALARGFAARAEKYGDEAAERATDMSRRMSRRFSSNRPLAPSRPGRPSTEGTFANYLIWQANAGGRIELDIATLKAAAPYWLIIEIGTGESARILNGGGGETVKSQKGRRISQSLFWADSASAPPLRPMTKGKRMEQIQAHFPMGMNQQLYPIEDISNAAYIPRAKGRTGRIRKEIKGKHFIQDGGATGFQFLRDETISDFKRTFLP